MYNKCKICGKASGKYIYCKNCYNTINQKEYDNDSSDDEKIISELTSNQLSQRELMEAYQSRSLLTKNEWKNYLILREDAAVKGYIVCPKVRLLDLVEPKKDATKWKTLLRKVQSKHVDFVICDIDMNVKLIIELDDSSHEREDRKERDKFVNLILRSAGYTVEHRNKITHGILDLI